jgi:hypothetical protein
MTELPITLSSSSCRDLGHALLARAREAEKPSGGLDLDEAGVERLTEILCAGSKPTVGFWVRYGRRRPDAAA